MKITWHISERDIAEIRSVVHKQNNNELVRQRRETNLATIKREIQKHDFWDWMVKMRLTSIQKSGPNHPVAKFNRQKPFPLSHKIVLNAKNPQAIIVKVLREAGGIRFTNKISKELGANFDLLEGGEWERTLNECNRLLKPVAASLEREVANYIDKEFEGFGPKQSRNLLQSLGLTRYEIPIDSRVVGYLNKFGWPVHLSAAALADPHYYEFVLDGIQLLCAKCNVYPCILDAAIFALKDGDAWTKDNIY
jgi:hypothetical protein